MRVLSVHADYGCRSSGVCCSSGWTIPVGPGPEARLRAGLSRGRLVPPSLSSPARGREEACLRPAEGLPHGARVTLAIDAAGQCVFLDRARGNLCAVHRDLGEHALPSACRDFPRVVLRSPLGVSVTLSHYCPTAASMLFREGPAARIVENPPAFPPSRVYEGLDARAALPPLLRPGVLMSWPAWRLWEEHAVATVGRDDLAPEEAVAALAETAEEVRRWTPERGSFDDWLARTVGVDVSGRPRERPPPPRAAWELVASTVPASQPRPTPPDGAAGPREEILDPGLVPVVRRWLAAKAFASWLALQGEGLRTTVRGLRVSLDVLRAEGARGRGGAPGPVGPEELKEALRRADLLLVHLADPFALAKRLSSCERGGSGKERPAAW